MARCEQVKQIRELSRQLDLYSYELEDYVRDASCGCSSDPYMLTAPEATGLIERLRDRRSRTRDER
jgi:hypothetical protein